MQLRPASAEWLKYSEIRELTGTAIAAPSSPIPIYAKYRICHNDFMAILEAEFQVYDRTIRPEDSLLKAARNAHIDVRMRLNADKDLSEHLVSDFLQGSYARYTMNDPEDKADVDIIVVTRLHEQQWTPDGVLTVLSS